MAAPSVAVNGILKDITGAANAGKVIFTLVNYGGTAPVITGTGIVAEFDYTAQADNTGSFSVTVWGNHQITPLGTYYQVAIQSAEGEKNIVASYEFLSDGTYDLSTLTPLVSTPAGQLLVPNQLSIGSVTTVPNGTPAAASITGTAPNQVLNLTLPQGVQGITNFSGISATAGQTLVYNGTFGWQSQSKPYVDARDFTGTDMCAQINAAASSLGSTGGAIIIPAGSYTCSTTINFDQLRDITLQGVGGQTAGAQAATRIIYSGTGSVITARSSTGIRVSGIQILWSNAGFLGPVMEFNHVVASDTTWAEIDHCSFFASGAGAATPIVIDFDQTINSSIHHCTFQNYAVAIRGASGSGSYSNANDIHHNNFSSSTGTAQTAHIQNPGEAWKITNNTFEMGAAAGTPVVIGYASGFNSSKGVVFSSNWVGDNGASSATLITLSGSGFTVTGNMISGPVSPTTTAFALSAGTYGVTIVGNQIKNHSVGVVFNSNRQVHIAANDMTAVTTPFSGAPSSGYVSDFSNADAVKIYSTNGLTSSGPFVASSTFTVNGFSNMNDRLQISGHASLPTATGSSLYMASGFASPTAGRIYVGDGTGWQVEFAKRTASTDTTLFTFKDSGQFVSPQIYLSGSVTPGASQWGIDVNTTLSGTTESTGIVSIPQIAASVVATKASGFRAGNIGLGSGSAITTQIAFECSTLSSGGTNYCFKADNSSIDQAGKAIFSGGLLVGTGVQNSGTGIKHVRLGSCTTAATAGATCDTTVTWNGSFADTNYTAVCTVDAVSGGVPTIVGTSKTSTTLVVRIAALTAVASGGTLNCIAFHD